MPHFCKLEISFSTNSRIKLWNTLDISYNFEPASRDPWLFKYLNKSMKDWSYVEIVYLDSIKDFGVL